MQKELDKIEKNATMVVEQNMPKDAADALLKDVKVKWNIQSSHIQSVKAGLYRPVFHTCIWQWTFFSIDLLWFAMYPCIVGL